MHKLEVRELLLPGFWRQVRDGGFGTDATLGKGKALGVGSWAGQRTLMKSFSVDGNFCAALQSSAAQVVVHERGLCVFWWLDFLFFWLGRRDAAAAGIL